MILTETYERQKLYAFAAEFLLARGAKNVLDIACGDGEGSAILAEKLEFVTGADISDELVKSADVKFPRSNTKFLVADARKTTFPDQSFDAVVSNHTLEHLDEIDQKKFLAEIKRVLKAGGWFVLATPDREVWEVQGIAGLQKDHIRELSRRETQELLQGAGFEMKKVYGQELLKSRGLLFRRMLNFIKRMDMFKFRRLLSDKLVASVDEGTQPVTLTGEVLELKSGEKASINVFVCAR